MNTVIKDIREYLQDQAIAIKKSFLPVYLILIVYFLPCFFFVPYNDGNNIFSDNGIHHYIQTIGRSNIAYLTSFLSFKFIPNNQETCIYNEILFQLEVFALLAITGIILYNRVNPNYKKNFLTHIVMSSLFFSPFFFSNINFNIPNSLNFAMALSLAIFASCINSKNRIFNVLSKTLFLFLAHGFYQASINIFMVTSVIILLLEFLKLAEISKKNILENISSLIVSVFLYKFFVLDQITLNKYGLSRTEIYALDENFFLNISNKFLKCLQSITFPFSDANGICLAMFLLLGFLSFVIYSITKSNNKFKAVSIVAFSISLIIFFQAGLSILFVNQAPEVNRYLMAFTLVMFLCFYTTHFIIEKFAPQIKYIILIPVFFMMTMTHSGISLTNAQAKYRKKINDNFLNHLITKYDKQQNITYQRLGQFSPKIYMKNFKKSKFLESSLLDSFYVNFAYTMINYPKNIDITWFDEKQINPNEYRIIERNRIYAIAQKENHFLLIERYHPYYSKIKFVPENNKTMAQEKLNANI
jgi:hypothetical protein